MHDFSERIEQIESECALHRAKEIKHYPSLLMIWNV